MLSTIFFITAMTTAYFVPYATDQPTYVSWFAMDMVYIVDMDISRQLYPEDMNGPELSVSEQMSYLGLSTATTMGVLSLCNGVGIEPPWDFVAYFCVSSLAYAAWHVADVGWKW